LEYETPEYEKVSVRILEATTTTSIGLLTWHNIAIDSVLNFDQFDRWLSATAVKHQDECRANGQNSESTRAALARTRGNSCCCLYWSAEWCHGAMHFNELRAL